MNKYIISFFLVFGLISPVLGGNNNNNDKFNQIVDAIEKVENSKQYPFGIKSINTGGDWAKSRRICLNTVINTHKRWILAGKPYNYLDFLADRYCPKISDKQGNINWKKNIRSKLGKDFKI